LEAYVPTYQYACTACGHQLEAVQSFTDTPLTECPECEGRLRKLFSSVGIVFKGSGFYRTDSRAGANGSAEKADKAEKADRSPAPEKSSTDKPATDKPATDKPAAEKKPAGTKATMASAA
jgi:putative FmdB family regulatory protein